MEKETKKQQNERRLKTAEAVFFERQRVYERALKEYNEAYAIVNEIVKELEGEQQ